LRVDGSGAERYAAVLALLATEPAWQTDIVHAELDRVRGHPLGTLTFSLRYREKPLRDLLATVERQSIRCNVLGYVE